jgi:hypothetical protein
VTSDMGIAVTAIYCVEVFCRSCNGMRNRYRITTWLLTKLLPVAFQAVEVENQQMLQGISLR